MNRQTGEVQLQFLAEFVFTAAQAYTAPALKINTLLTTEAVRGKLHGGRGQRLDSSGRARWAMLQSQLDQPQVPLSVRSRMPGLQCGSLENVSCSTWLGARESCHLHRLVGISEVPRTSDAFINSFLTLPSEAYAVLSSRLSFS